jgi:hypothetical protein
MGCQKRCLVNPFWAIMRPVCVFSLCCSSGLFVVGRYIVGWCDGRVCSRIMGGTLMGIVVGVYLSVSWCLCTAAQGHRLVPFGMGAIVVAPLIS